MPYVYLICAIVLMPMLSLVAREFNRKNEGEENTAPFYNFLVCAAACLTWGVIYAFDFSFEPKALLYSLGFGVCYAVIVVSLLKALAAGPTSLTVLIQKFSLIVTTVWGFAVWGSWDKHAAPFIISGLVLVAFSLVLSLYSGKKSQEKISLKWAAYTFMAFAGNAACSIIQKQQQLDFNGAHGPMFMFFAMLTAALIYLGIFLASEKPDVKKLISTSWAYPLTAGVSNAFGNMCIVLLATSALSPNLIYPAIAVGGLAMTSVISAWLFKEKLKWWQWVGILVGALAVALLSIH